MSILTQVETSPCEYIYIGIVAETFCLSLLKLLSSTFMPLNYISSGLSFWIKPADTHGKETAAGKISVLHTSSTSKPMKQAVVFFLILSC